MFDIDYSTVSVRRKRLRHKIQNDNDLKRPLTRIEENLSNINRLSENRYFNRFTLTLFQ